VRSTLGTILLDDEYEVMRKLVESKLGIACAFSMLDLAEVYAKPFEHAGATLQRLAIHEALIKSHWRQDKAASHLRMPPDDLQYYLVQRGANTKVLRRELVEAMGAQTRRRSMGVAR
jgi:transcriptional regulator with GAF, ATPase, and Fis domain